MNQRISGKIPATSFALAVLLASVTPAPSQDREPHQPTFGWLYEHQPQITSAVAAKTAAAQNADKRADSSSPGTNAGTFVTFDVPAAVDGTYSVSIALGGDVTGYYYDANSLSHGFLRTKGGNITTFDAPAAVNGTYPAAIDALGVITGHYCDVNDLCHGFLRTPNGVVTSFDPADVGGTYPLGIGPQGSIPGYYWDADYVGRGFVRAPDGSLITFAVPDAVNGTYPVSITSSAAAVPSMNTSFAGQIAGAYVDSVYTVHGFIGTNGVTNSFDPPGELGFYAPYSFGPGLGINPAGAVAGYYFETVAGNPFGGNYRGFLRSRDGSFTTFDAASASSCCLWTFPYSINPSGVITGSYNDTSSVNHGFLRDGDGTVTTLDVPGAGTGFGQGTVSLSINTAGVTTGFYIDANNLHHGFLYEP